MVNAGGISVLDGHISASMSLVLCSCTTCSALSTITLLLWFVGFARAHPCYVGCLSVGPEIRPRERKRTMAGLFEHSSKLIVRWSTVTIIHGQFRVTVSAHSGSVANCERQPLSVNPSSSPFNTLFFQLHGISTSLFEQ